MKSIIEEAKQISQMQEALDKKLTIHVRENFKSVLTVTLHNGIFYVRMLSMYEFWFGCSSLEITSVIDRIPNNADIEQVRADKIEAKLIFADIKNYCEEVK